MVNAALGSKTSSPLKLHKRNLQKLPHGLGRALAIAKAQTRAKPKMDLIVMIQYLSGSRFGLLLTGMDFKDGLVWNYRRKKLMKPTVVTYTLF